MPTPAPKASKTRVSSGAANDRIVAVRRFLQNKIAGDYKVVTVAAQHGVVAGAAQ
jgi:hypothetical protein